MCKFFCYQSRLIITAFAQTSRVERHGDQATYGEKTFPPYVSHQFCQRKGQCSPSSVFQCVNRLANNPLKQRCPSNAIQPERPRCTPGTDNLMNRWIPTLQNRG